MRRHWGTWIGVSVAACGAGCSTDASDAGVHGGVEKAETGAETHEAGACEIPVGAVFTVRDASVPDGGTPPGCRLSHATINTKPMCKASEFNLTCVSAAMFTAIPDPPASTRCTAVPIPTPSSLLFYCCPCGG